MHRITSAAVLLGVAIALPAHARADEEKPEFPKWEEVSKDFEKVVSTADGAASLYGLWTRKKDNQMLAELPAGYENQKHFIALTAPTGEIFAGLQIGELYVYWKRFDKRIALIAPDLLNRADADAQVKDALKRHFPDQVIVDVPIVCMGPNGQPVIDMDELLVNKADTFYGEQGLKSQLATIDQAKAFPENVEITFEVPDNSGALKKFHYSISRIPDSTDYQPRIADNRVGYFLTAYRDLGKFRDDQVSVRYVNRWKLEKADPKLKVSPPKEPIRFYLEHTVPVRYRRWVKEGALAWNKAFEKVGISDAVVVEYQDKETGANMDKDPEDVRYNFIRWLSNDIGTAIGPSRAHPLTGQILDADVILTDGWIRHFWYQANEFLPEEAMEGFTSETLRWLDEHPDWDPRLRLADAGERARLLEERNRRLVLGSVAAEVASGDGAAMQSGNLQDLALRRGSMAMLCSASDAKAQSMRLMGLTFAIHGLVGEEVEGSDESDKIDGIPEWFVGPSLADLVMHEVGHTLGLRHNFKATSVYSLKDVNSAAFKGQKPFAGSVMDYIPVNVNMGEGEVQGDFVMCAVGPYDMWAIEYGYTFGDPKEVLKRVGEPELAYLTDEDTSGPDPLARRYDFAQDPLDFAENRMKIATHARQHVLEKFVKDGEPWAKTRRGYEITLGEQLGAISIMANWLGGAHVERLNKGDAANRAPLQVVSAERQRKALRFVVENSFFDSAFDLNPELMSHMTTEKWYDPWDWSSASLDSTWPVHDRVSGIQASVLTMLMNPTKLRRVYDNEFCAPRDQDCFTLSEMMESVASAVWAEIGYAPDAYQSDAKAVAASAPKGKLSPRTPMVSSLRRSLQREHLERLIDLCMQRDSRAASRTISMLARSSLRGIGGAIADNLKSELDPYTKAHLEDAGTRIQKALEASYTYDRSSSPYGPMVFFGRESED